MFGLQKLSITYKNYIYIYTCNTYWKSFFLSNTTFIGKMVVPLLVPLLINRIYLLYSGCIPFCPYETYVDIYMLKCQLLQPQFRPVPPKVICMRSQCRGITLLCFHRHQKTGKDIIEELRESSGAGLAGWQG